MAQMTLENRLSVLLTEAEAEAEMGGRHPLERDKDYTENEAKLFQLVADLTKLCCEMQDEIRELKRGTRCLS